LQLKDNSDKNSAFNWKLKISMHALPPNVYADGRRRFEALLVLTWASLDDALQQADSKLADEIRDWFNQISNLNARQLIDDGTPFWWFDVAQCWRAAISGSQQTPEYAANMLVAAFDAFFADLPNGATVHLNGNGDSEIVLPKLGLNIPATLRPTAISRSGANAIAIYTRDVAGVVTINLDEDRDRFSSSRLAIPGHEGQYVLCSPSKALIGDDPRANLTGRDFDSPAFTNMLGGALTLIQNECPELYQQIRTANKWYVPILTHDIRVHRSYTREDLTGVMFLSEAIDHVLLAEAVVHEFYHGILNSIMKTEPLYDETDSSETFYSPWRDDPRPLRGLLHAIYVFSGVTRFYAASGRALARSEHAETLRLRRSKLHQQLRYALAQVPADKLTLVGRQVIGEIASQVNNESDASELFDPGVAAMLEDHLAGWRTRNPTLRVEPIK
jgi:HEXXH motif-containing protein